jgi:heavy metal-(Cd/Co/Hg/Pb/Zn)-translocating P-type ATPase
MDKEQKSTLARVIIAAVIFTAGELLHYFAGNIDSAFFSGLPWLTVSTACFLAAYIIAGAGVLAEAVEHIVHGNVFDEDFLMSIATIGAICLQQFDEAAGVMVFFLVGELFEEFAEGRSRDSISELMDIRPDFATLLTGTISGEGIVGGIEQQVDPSAVHIGDVIIVKPGEKVPLDGTVISGRASLDTSALTGESLPAEIEEGSHIVSGCIDLDGVIRIKVESEFGESTVSKILDLVENAGSKKAHIEKFITRFARIYTPAVVGAAALLAVIPPLFVPGQMWHTWIYRALLFLVISCPCALVISVPLSFFGGIGAASKSGVLVKGSNYLEALGKVDTVIFDKTGTITTGSFTVTDVVGPDDLLETAAHAEYYSNHPISKSITEAYAAVGGHADPARVSDIEEIAGKGLSANVDGRKVYAGNARLMDDLNISGLNSDDAATLVHVAVEDRGGIRYYGSISIEDTIKPCSIAAVSRLAAAGVKRTVMLTGDRKVIADKIARIVGISEVHSELLPADKVAIAEGIIGGKALNGNGSGSGGNTGFSRSGKVAFVGDGINDAPVLARADVGIAMGALGSQAAIEAADVVIMDDDLEKIGKVIDIARKTASIARQNVTIALAIKGMILILGAIGLANMWAAVFADVGVTIIAIINAMRTLLIK